MTPKVQFVKDLNDCILPDIPEDSYVLYHSRYEPPEIPGAKVIEFEDFKNVYSEIHVNLLIIFGLNRIITPSNRTHFVFEWLFTISRDIPKITIDLDPWIGEPWRLWFHYGVTYTGKFAIPYSYTIETEWKHWFYRKRKDSRLSGDNLGICITDTYSNLDPLDYGATFYSLNDMQLNWYEEAKAHVFEKYTTPKLWMNNLLKMCNTKFGIDYSLDAYRSNNPISLPELGVYEFMHEENKRRAGMYNAVLKAAKR